MTDYIQVREDMSVIDYVLVKAKDRKYIKNVKAAA